MLDNVINDAKTSLEKWAKQHVILVMLVACFATLVAIVVPFRNNWDLFPKFLIGVALLVLVTRRTGGGKSFWKWVRAMAFIFLIVVTASIFMPKTARALRDNIQLDKSLSEAVSGARTDESDRQVPVVARVRLGQVKPVTIRPGETIAAIFEVLPGDGKFRWGRRFSASQERGCVEVSSPGGIFRTRQDCRESEKWSSLAQIKETTSMVVRNLEEDIPVKVEFFMLPQEKGDYIE